jgi:hypothetical protein
MDNEKVNQALQSIALQLKEIGHTPHRLPPNAASPNRMQALNHAMALAVIGLELPEEKLGKKFRWLGFCQGVLWSYGCATIGDLKEVKRP